MAKMEANRFSSGIEYLRLALEEVVSDYVGMIANPDNQLTWEAGFNISGDVNASPLALDFNRTVKSFEYDYGVEVVSPEWLVITDWITNPEGGRGLTLSMSVTLTRGTGEYLEQSETVELRVAPFIE